jgi:hypothetical protein
MQERLTPEALGLAITDARTKAGKGGLLAQVAIMEHAGTCESWPFEMRKVAVDLYNELGARTEKSRGGSSVTSGCGDDEGHPGSRIGG